MSVSQAVLGMGTVLSMGDGGIGAGTQASKIIGASNQALKVLAAVAGTPGNLSTFGVVISGNSTPFSAVVTPTSVLVNGATDSGGVSTTTVLDAISQLYLAANFAANFQATRSAGNGTGVIVAGASGVLSGGAAGAEIFTPVAEIGDVDGPGEKLDTVETTHMQSPGNYREYLGTLADGVQVTFPMNFINVASQTAVRSTLRNAVKRNWQLTFNTPAGAVTNNFAAWTVGWTPGYKKEGAIMANVTLKVTGPVS